jgi:cyclase
MRIIARLDVKNNFVIKGINFEGLRKIGDPLKLAKKYYEEKIDEIMFIDAVASLYDRNNLFDIIDQSTKEIFCPITLGGGIRTLEDIEKALKSGADKVAINSHAIENPQFIKQAVENFGSSTILVNIEAKKIDNDWEIYKYYGREKTGIKLLEWLDTVQEMNCGEIILTSIDKEGLQKGLDFKLLDYINNKINRPLIFSGGFNNLDELKKIKKHPFISISIASVLHYQILKVQDIKNG